MPRCEKQASELTGDTQITYTYNVPISRTQVYKIALADAHQKLDEYRNAQELADTVREGVGVAQAILLSMIAELPL